MFIDNLVTRLPNGITNREPGDIFNSLRMLDPTRYHTYFEDFDYYNADDWTVTEGDVASTQALADGAGGLLLLTAVADDGDIVALNKVGESFNVVAGQKLFFKARFAVSTALELEFIMGLQITDASPFDAADGIWFAKADDALGLDFVVELDTAGVSEIAEDIAIVEDDEFLEVAFFWDGVDRVYYGVNGAVLGYLPCAADEQSLTISFAFAPGEDVADTMTVDYVFAAQER